MKRSFYICRREKELAEKLCDLVEREIAGNGCLMFGDPDGTLCGGLYKCGQRLLRRFSGKRKQTISDIPRRVTLFTLNHGDISVILLDWDCSRCGFRNLYRVVHHGIFPARYCVAFTVELLYWWLHEMCSNTNSFRAVYETVTKLRCSPTFNCRFISGRLRKLQSTHKPNRRVANDAMRKFINSIDVEGDDNCKELYTCEKCEVTVDQSDIKQLGLDADSANGKKIFKGVVIDGKVVALLKELGPASDNHDILQSEKGIRTGVVTNRDTQNALRLFFKLTRSVLVSVMSGKVGCSSDACATGRMEGVP